MTLDTICKGAAQRARALAASLDLIAGAAASIGAYLDLIAARNPQLIEEDETP